MNKQCETCIKADVCMPIYHKNEFEDKPCRKYVEQVPPMVFRFMIGSKAYYITYGEKGGIKIGLSKINEMKINSSNRIRYRVEGCGRDLTYGEDVFRTKTEVKAKVSQLRKSKKNDAK